jgi:ferredoxin
VHDGVHAAQRVAPAGGIREVTDRQLDPHALGFEATRIANEAAHRGPAGREAADDPVAQQSRGTGHQNHDQASGYATIRAMAYVIAEPCIGTKDNSCVEVCPVDCIHPTPDEPDYDKVEMLYIDPEECIDCDACVEACPVDACFAEDQLPDEWANYAEKNAAYYAGRS